MKTTFAQFKKRISLQYTGIAVSVLSVLLIPVAVFAWGPDRPTYTMEVPADHVTFNSITNNPRYGDERNFFRVREAGSATGTPYLDSTKVEPGKQYQIMVFYHNNAASNLNADGTGIAHGAYTRAEIPAVVKKGSSAPADAYVSATNANPTSVYDDITFQNDTAGDIALRYVPGSTAIHSFGKVDGTKLPDSILSAGGVALGYDALDGNLPGCNEYSGYVTFNVLAEQPNFTFAKQVRLSGTTTWAKNVNAKPGDTVDYMLSYANTGTTEQKDVVLKDTLPTGLSYVTGSSKLKNATHPNGDATSDGIGAGGINIGDYAKDSNAFLLFSTKIGTEADCKIVKNVAAVETNNGNATDEATVTVNSGNCTTVAAALPETGPAEVILTLIGIAAVTFGVVYYLRSRRDLQTALHAAQSHTVTTSKQIGAAPVAHTSHEATTHEHKK